MIQNLEITFEHNDLQHSIRVPDEMENIPYNIAEAMIEIISFADANPEIVIEQLIEEYGYKENTEE